MEKLNKIKNVVTRILEKNTKARKDDFILFSCVCDELGVVSNFDFRTMLNNHKLFGLPSWESVSRARRKIQAERPELKDAEMAEIRDAEQEKYIEFARR